MRYRFAEKIVTCDGGATMGVPVIDWRGEENQTDADAATEAARNPEEKASKHAERFLRAFLQDDEKPSAEILEAAQKKGISRRTLFRVKQDLNVKATRKAGAWWWQPLQQCQ